MRPWLGALGLLGAFALLYASWKRGRLALGFMVVAALLAAAWMVAYVAMSLDYRDADGWVDCWPGCTALQDSVGTALVLAPVVLVAVALFSATLGAITSRRERGSRRRG